MQTRAIFVGGTASHVGKSWTTAAICRYLRGRGFRVAPFKAQNMSNNSYPCPGGGEIGRAQVAQAEACGLEPHPDMNPILLKPNSDSSSQVVLHGRVWKTLKARDYYGYFEYLEGQVREAYDRLASRFDFIVMEGAGSVAELNLKSRDLVNLRMARNVGAPALLVGDIDRGGIFAAIVGSISLLEPEEATLIRSFAVNRFRGDPSLFEDGVRILEERTARRCLGVFPYARDFTIDEEDGVSVEGSGGASSIGILQFPRISNTTDFRLLPDARWISSPIDRQLEAILLPGSKNTLADLAWLRERRLDVWLEKQIAGGAKVLGICGGFQMLGCRIDDPYKMETELGSAEGLGFLPIETVLARDKVTRTVEAETQGGVRFSAYEIHLGETVVLEPVAAFFKDEGVRCNGVAGTYLHGAIENAAVLSEWLGRPIAEPLSKEASYDALGRWFERHANVKLFEELYL